MLKKRYCLNSYILIAIALFISGCGIKFLYNQLDWLVPWYLDDYVSLNSHQEKFLDTRLSGYLERHRQQKIPIYADFLETFAKQAEDGLNESEINNLFKQAEKFRSELFTSIPETFSDLFLDLTDEQIAEIADNLDRDVSELTERFIDKPEQEQREIRSDEMKSFLQDRLGELNDSQIQRIETWSQEYLLLGEEFIHSRQLWQTQFLDLLRQRKQLKDFKPRLSRLFMNRYSGRSAQHWEKIRFNEQLLRKLYLDIDQSMESYQRHLFVRNIRSFALDFRALSQE